MGWNGRTERKLGSPPEWAEVLSPCAEPTREFLSTLHCMLPINGGASENWPRIGLEAMAAGVPLVAQNQWGWQEMIDHGRTGFLADTDDDLACYAGQLATDEDLRLRIVQTAHKRLVDDIASPEKIWSGWSRLFEFVQSQQSVSVLHRQSEQAAEKSQHEDHSTAADHAWQALPRNDLDTMTLKDILQAGFAAGRGDSGRDAHNGKQQKCNDPNAVSTVRDALESGRPECAVPTHN
jgi:hypothetical protein